MKIKHEYSSRACLHWSLFVPSGRLWSWAISALQRHSCQACGELRMKTIRGYCQDIHRRVQLQLTSSQSVREEHQSSDNHSCKCTAHARYTAWYYMRASSITMSWSSAKKWSACHHTTPSSTSITLLTTWKSHWANQVHSNREFQALIVCIHRRMMHYQVVYPSPKLPSLYAPMNQLMWSTTFTMNVN